MVAAKGRKSKSYNELRAEIRADKIARLYVLYGEEGFLIDKLLESLETALIAPGSRDLDLVTIDSRSRGSQADIEHLQAEIATMPFLSRRKLILFRGSGWFAAGKEETQNLILLLEKLPDSVCLVFYEEKVDRRQKKLVQVIENNGVLAEIGRQQPRMLKAWVEVEGRRRSLEITADAAESLVDRCDGDMRLIWQELDKIFLYCRYTGSSRVDKELIGFISLPDLKGSIFDLTDALSAGRTQIALQLLGRLISQKQPVQLIQFMLARHLRQLICAAELGSPDKISAALKVMPFVAGRLSRQARQMELDVLERLYALCYETDLAVKTGKISDILGLEILLVTAAESAAGRMKR